MRASTSRCATDFSRPYFAARWVTRSSLLLSEDRSSSENLPHLPRISLIMICLVSADGVCPVAAFLFEAGVEGEVVIQVSPKYRLNNRRNGHRSNDNNHIRSNRENTSH